MREQKKSKICKRCGSEKDYTSFYKHKAMADGHLSFCKSCYKKTVNNYRDDNSEKIKKFDRDRANLPHRVKAREEYRKLHKDKRDYDTKTS